MVLLGLRAFATGDMSIGVPYMGNLTNSSGTQRFWLRAPSPPSASERLGFGLDARQRHSVQSSGAAVVTQPSMRSSAFNLVLLFNHRRKV